MTLQNPAATPEESAGWQRRHVLKAGAVAAGVGLLGRFAHASAGDAVSPADYQSMDAWDMANAVRKGELAPEHLLAAALARCDAVNPKVNAVTCVTMSTPRRCSSRAALAVRQMLARWPGCRS